MKQLQPQCLFTAFNINAEASSFLDVYAPLFLPVEQKVALLLLQKSAVEQWLLGAEASHKPKKKVFAVSLLSNTDLKTY